MLKESTDGSGYLKVDLRKNKTKHTKRIHKLVAQAFLLNPENKKCVDHIDNNTHNNNLINLRFATPAQNQHNRSINNNNTSGTKGVCWDKTNNRWKAQICINGKTIHLGLIYEKPKSRKPALF